MLSNFRVVFFTVHLLPSSVSVSVPTDSHLCHVEGIHISGILLVPSMLHMYLKLGSYLSVEIMIVWHSCYCSLEIPCSKAALTTVEFSAMR